MSLLDLKPNLRPFSAQDYWTVAEGVTPPAFDALGAGFVESAVTGLMGTIARDVMTPDPVPQDTGQIMDRDLNAPRKRAALAMRQEQARAEGGGELDEAGWKASEFAREGLKWEPGMTNARAAALADLYDESKYRQTILSNAKGGAYAAGIAGQFLGAAVDPINYVPVLGPATKAAAVAKFGRIGGSALVGAGDAALNTAAAQLAIRDARAVYGDDVSWTSFAIDVAMGAAIGGMFGAGAGAWEKLRANRQANTLPRVAEAQGAFNEAVGDIVTGRPVQMSDTAIAAMRKSADELAPVLRQATGAENAQVPAPTTRAVMPPIGAATNVGVDGWSVRALPEAEGWAKGTQVVTRADLPEDELAVLANTPPDGEAGASRVPGVSFREINGAVFIGHSYLPKGERGAGTGTAIYEGLVKAAHERGMPVHSDSRVSAEAAKVYDRLAERGYDVRRNDEFEGEPTLNIGPDGKLIHKYGDPVFTIMPRAEAAAAAPTRAIDPSPAPLPEPDPRAIEAAASVGRPVSGEQALADDLGIDIEAGDSPVMMELEQLRQAGRLTEAEEQMLSELQAEGARAEAIGEALKAAAACRMI